MTQPLFRGAATALVTPLRDGKVDVDALRRLVEQQLENGVAALVSCGTTGEPSTLSLEERELVIRETVKAVNGRVPVICGTGANFTQTVIDNERRFRDLGCAALHLGSAVQGAWLNVLINLGSIRDAAFAAQYRTRGQILLDEALPLAQSIYDRVLKAVQG